MIEQNGYTNNLNAQTHNSGLSELMSNRPSWIVRKGNTIFLIIGLCFVLLCWVIKYPDIVKGTARLLPSNYPGQGQLYAEIMVASNNHDRIKAGQKVVIKMDADAPKKNVYLTGFISYVSTMANLNDGFIIRADFPDNHERIAFFKERSPISAEIIVGNKRVLNNVTEQLKKIWQ